jgi:hypothetical protein
MGRFLASGLATAFILVPWVGFGILAGEAVGALVGHVADLLGWALIALGAFVVIAFGGAAWGSSMSRISSGGHEHGMALGAAVGVAPVVVVVALLLTYFERLFVEQRQLPDVPIDNIYTLLFTSALAIVTGTAGFALSVGAGQRAAAPILAAQCALGGGLTFLAVNLTLDALGMRVGAPGAEERLTMITTTFLGSFAAAFIAGGIIGTGLRRRRMRLQPQVLG